MSRMAKLISIIVIGYFALLAFYAAHALTSKMIDCLHAKDEDIDVYS